MGANSPIPPQDLDRIRLPIEDPPTAPDPQTIEEKNSLEIAHQVAVIDSMRQDMGERKKYAHPIFVLICAWIGVVLVIVIVQGFGYHHFSLPEGVMLAIIGTTTLNVLGIF